MSDETNRLKQAQEARRVNLAAWRASRLHALDDMPSGLPVIVKDMTLQDLVMMDGVEIPNTLLDLMLDNDQKQARGEPDAQNDSDVVLQMMRNKDDFNQLLNELVKACLVEPLIGAQADDTHITLDELSFADKMHLFGFLNREAAAVRPFPDAADAGALAQPGGSLRDKAISDAELAERVERVSV